MTTPAAPRWIAAAASAALFAGCAPGDGRDGDAGAFPFEEVAAASGVDFTHTFGPTRFWMPEVSAAGVALFDMDGDGDLDLYALQSGDLDAGKGDPRPGNRLFANRGDGTFEDVTERAGVGDTGFAYGCAVGDFDGDGRLDLYVTNVGPNVLYRNLGDGRFEDVTDAAGVACEDWGTAASFVDHDGDGDLDLFVVNYMAWSPAIERSCENKRGQRTYCAPTSYGAPVRDTLLENRGDGTFVDVSEDVGLGAAFGTGLGLVWGELDDRPGVDLYVANDGMPNQLWSRTPEGRFEDRASILGCALSGDGAAEAGMGVCLEDLDRDGAWDLFVTHLDGETNTLYRGGRAGFTDRTTRSGTMGASLARTGFGVGMVDFDHDGRLDLYVANGRVTAPADPVDPERPLAQHDQLFRGVEGGRFEEVQGALWRDAPPTVARGAAFGDLDGDGDVDVVVTECGGPLRILRNVAGKRGRAVTLSVLERDGLAAVGAVVRFDLAGTRVQRQVQRTSSYCSSNDPRVHVGIGDAADLGPVEVTWRDGSVEAFGPIEAGAAVALRRGEGRAGS